MTQTEIQQIREYLNEVKATLYDPDNWPGSWQAELVKLEETITELAVTGVQTEDKFDRVKLAYLEMKARHCRECILILLGRRN
jgi:hypothetical protein